MSSDPPSRLVRWLERTQAGHLRVVARYDEDGYEWLFRRDDVADTYSQDAFDRTFDNYRWIAPIAFDQAEAMEAGSLRANLNVFDRVIVIQFLETPEQGTIVSFDADIGEDLVEIVANGLQLLIGDREADAMPEWVTRPEE